MRDYRKSCRRATSVATFHCELMLGSLVLPAMLLNESKKGFGVLVSGMPSIAPNQRAQLHNYRGWFDCQIVYAMEVVPTTRAIYTAAGVYDEVGSLDADDDDREEVRITAYDIDKFTASTKGPWFRLGIRWVHQLKSGLTPATALPIEGGFSPMQWLKSAIPSLFDR
jgi:hypothetical protein